jgi:His-Xaa-Ser repeat protein HxsA
VNLLDRWKVLISGITLLPMAGTTLAQAGNMSLADANWQPADKLQPPVFADTLNVPDAVNIYAAHRSHSSHSSHSSHYSGSGGYSAPRYYSPPATSTRSYSAPNASSSTPSSNSLYQSSGTTSGTSSSTSKSRATNEQKSNLVTRVQTALMVRQYYQGTIDGVMGKTTRGALMAFQMDSGLTVNGRMDTPSLNALGIKIP